MKERIKCQITEEDWATHEGRDITMDNGSTFHRHNHGTQSFEDSDGWLRYAFQAD